MALSRRRLPDGGIQYSFSPTEPAPGDEVPNETPDEARGETADEHWAFDRPRLADPRDLPPAFLAQPTMAWPERRRSSRSAVLLTGMLLGLGAAVISMLALPLRPQPGAAERPRPVADHVQPPAARPPAREPRPEAPPAITTLPVRDADPQTRTEIAAGEPAAPAAAALAAAEAPRPTPLEERTKELLRRRGADLMAGGNVAAARLIYRHAAEAGDAPAAFALAETYDPLVLGRLGVRGITADLAMARSWYETARRLGSGEAAARIARLASPDGR
jgi:hypothetical protein